MNTEEKLLERIVVNPKMMGGKPIVKGTRITVEQVLKLLAQGISSTEIVKDYPHLNKRRHFCSLALRRRSSWRRRKFTSDNYVSLFLEVFSR